jgi:hypothetical protein
MSRPEAPEGAVSATVEPVPTGFRLPVKRIVQALVSLVIVVGIFVYAIPRFADYSAVWNTISELSPLEMGSLVVATVSTCSFCSRTWRRSASRPGGCRDPDHHLGRGHRPRRQRIAVGSRSRSFALGLRAQSSRFYIAVTGI